MGMGRYTFTIELLPIIFFFAPSVAIFTTFDVWGGRKNEWKGNSCREGGYWMRPSLGVCYSVKQMARRQEWYQSHGVFYHLMQRGNILLRRFLLSFLLHQPIAIVLRLRDWLSGQQISSYQDLYSTYINHQPSINIICWHSEYSSLYPPRHSYIGNIFSDAKGVSPAAEAK